MGAVDSRRSSRRLRTHDRIVTEVRAFRLFFSAICRRRRSTNPRSKSAASFIRWRHTSSSFACLSARVAVGFTAANTCVRHFRNNRVAANPGHAAAATLLPTSLWPGGGGTAECSGHQSTSTALHPRYYSRVRTRRVRRP